MGVVGPLFLREVFSLDIFSFYMPTRLFFRQRRRAQARQSAPAGGLRPDYHRRHVDHTARLCRPCGRRAGQAGHETAVYNKVQPSPTIEGVRECAALAARRTSHSSSALGGGSSIDTAKAAAVMATNDGDWWDYVHGGTGGGKRIANAGLPVVAIPTTAGTGTEADPFTVITNGEEKIGGGGESASPAISVVDPDFTMTVPPHLTAYQGFDAFFHAAEGYIARTASPMSDMFSAPRGRADRPVARDRRA